MTMPRKAAEARAASDTHMAARGRAGPAVVPTAPALTAPEATIMPGRGPHRAVAAASTVPAPSAYRSPAHGTARDQFMSPARARTSAILHRLASTAASSSSCALLAPRTGGSLERRYAGGRRATRTRVYMIIR